MSFVGMASVFMQSRGASVRSLRHSCSTHAMASSVRHGRPYPVLFGFRRKSGSGRSCLAGCCRCSRESGRCGRPQCSSVSAVSYRHGLSQQCFVHGIMDGALGGVSSRQASACSVAVWVQIPWIITSVALSSIVIPSHVCVCHCRRASMIVGFIFSFWHRGSASTTTYSSGGRFCLRQPTGYIAVTAGARLSTTMRS